MQDPPPARSKEQGTRSKEQGTRSKEQGTGGREKSIRNSKFGIRNPPPEPEPEPVPTPAMRLWGYEIPRPPGVESVKSVEGVEGSNIPSPSPLSLPFPKTGIGVSRARFEIPRPPGSWKGLICVLLYVLWVFSGGRRCRLRPTPCDLTPGTNADSGFQKINIWRVFGEPIVP